MHFTEKDFIGFWKTDQRLLSADPQDGDVTLEFNADGTARYSFYYPDKKEFVTMNYRIEGDHIVTEQNNAQTIRTKFAFEPDGSLLLWFSGVKGRFLKR